jgi:hypothetical protein
MWNTKFEYVIHRNLLHSVLPVAVIWGRVVANYTTPYAFENATVSIYHEDFISGG